METKEVLKGLWNKFSVLPVGFTEKKDNEMILTEKQFYKLLHNLCDGLLDIEQSKIEMELAKIRNYASIRIQFLEQD